MYVCLCKAITDRQVRHLGEEGVISPESLIKILNVDDEESCGFCKQYIGRMVAIAKGGDPMKYGKFMLDPEMIVKIDDPDMAP